jgi:hypothetical protein
MPAGRAMGVAPAHEVWREAGEARRRHGRKKLTPTAALFVASLTSTGDERAAHGPRGASR